MTYPTRRYYAELAKAALRQYNRCERVTTEDWIRETNYFCTYTLSSAHLFTAENEDV